MTTPHLPPHFLPRRRLVLQGLALAAAGSMTACATPGNSAMATQSGSFLLRGGQVVSMDVTIGDLQIGDVLVRDGRIEAVGPALSAPGVEIIDMRGRVVMPGFVDTHWHMWNTIARGLDSSMHGLFARTMAELARVWTPQASALSVRLACAEAVQCGITTVNNWAHHIKTPEFAAAELASQRASGLRGRFSFGYAQSLKPDEMMDLAALETFRQREFGGAPAGLVSLGVATRGPDRSDDRVWRTEFERARALGLPVTAHLASDRASAAKGNIAIMARDKFLGPDVQLVHATQASRRDFELMREAGSPLSISPWTELEVGYGLPALNLMASSGVEMGLSVDNMVLAGQASMFDVMRLTVDLAAGQGEQQGLLSRRKVLEWATVGGARGLGLAGVTGTLTPGKRADIIAIDRKTLNTSPVSDVTFLLTHAARPADVDLVMIDGVLHKRDKRLMRVDVPALLAEANETIARLRSQARV